MRSSILIKLLLFVSGIWLLVYIMIKMIFIYIENSKFDLDKYRNINYFPLTSNSTLNFSYKILPEGDYNNLIDIYFNFTNISFPCNVERPLLLLVLIHSSPTNFAKRKTIRETWGRNTDDKKILFVLGSVKSEKVKKNVIAENDIHNDIIQGSFLDSYRNLTYKHTMALKYVVYHCPLVKYVLKTDDDIFVNMPLMENFLTKDLSPYGTRNLLMCPIVYKARVIRTYRSKWRVSFTEYQHKRYPTYCLGWTILYSRDVVFNLYRETQRTKYFWIDDAHITGIIARKINFADHVDITPLTLTRTEVNQLIHITHKRRPFLFGNADMSEDEIRHLWKYVADSPIPESIKNEK